MDVKQDYSGLLFTHHARGQVADRGMKQDMVWETWKNPDHVTPGKKIETERFIKKFDNTTVTVIAKHTENHEWLVVSCWMDPPLPGTRDAKQKEAYKNYQKKGFWGKFFLTIKSQLGM